MQVFAWFNRKKKQSNPSTAQKKKKPYFYRRLLDAINKKFSRISKILINKFKLIDFILQKKEDRKQRFFSSLLNKKCIFNQINLPVYETYKMQDVYLEIMLPKLRYGKNIDLQLISHWFSTKHSFILLI